MKQWHEQFGQHRWVLTVDGRQVAILDGEGGRFAMRAVIDSARCVPLGSRSLHDAKIEAEEAYKKLLKLQICDYWHYICQYESQLKILEDERR